MHTSDVVGEYLVSCAAGGLARKTLSTYAWGLQYLPPRLPVSALELEQVLAGQDLAPESKGDLFRIWKTFFGWAARRHLLTSPMPDVRKPRKVRTRPRVFTQTEIAAAWRSCATQRDRAMVALLLDTGIRLGELATLTWSAIGTGVILVDGKTGRREVPLSQQAQTQLVGLGDLHGPWSGPRGPLTVSGAGQAIRRLHRAAGLTGPKLGPHTWRHTFATNFLRRGGNLLVLQRILGHSSLETTQLYVQLAGEDLSQEHAASTPLAMLWEA